MFTSPFCHQDLQGEDHIGGDDKEHQRKENSVKEADVAKKKPPGICFKYRNTVIKVSSQTEVTPERRQTLCGYALNTTLKA